MDGGIGHLGVLRMVCPTFVENSISRHMYDSNSILSAAEI